MLLHSAHYLEVLMKRTISLLLSIAIIAATFVSCSSLKPFTQKQLDQISGFPSAQAGN